MKVVTSIEDGELVMKRFSNEFCDELVFFKWISKIVFLFFIEVFVAFTMFLFVF